VILNYYILLTDEHSSDEQAEFMTHRDTTETHCKEGKTREL